MSATEAEILALEDRRWAAQIGKDADELATLLSDDLQYTHSTGSIDTKSSYMASILENVVDYQSSDRSDTAVTLVSNAAVVTGRATVDVVARGNQVQLNLSYTVVWLEGDNGWQLLTWHSTPRAN